MVNEVYDLQCAGIYAYDYDNSACKEPTILLAVLLIMIGT